MKLMLVPWIIGFLFYGPSVIFWEYWVGRRLVPADQCYVEFFDNVPYLISNSVIEFIVPFVIVATINLLIYYNIRRRSRSLLTENNTVKCFHISSANHTQADSTNVATNQKLTSSNNNKISPSLPDAAKSAYQEAAKTTSPTNQNRSDQSAGNGKQQTHQVSKSIHQPDSRSKQSLLRDRKTARSLAILVGIFLLTWAPYEICAMVNPMCDFCIPGTVFDIVFWLLWVNSTINPFLYALLQVRFRRAFVGILQCRGTSNLVKPITAANL